MGRRGGQLVGVSELQSCRPQHGWGGAGEGRRRWVFLGPAVHLAWGLAA